MKTYTKMVEVTKPRLEIYHDFFADNPREWHCAGYLLSVSNKYCDDTDVHNLDRPATPHTSEELEAIVNEAVDRRENGYDCIELMHQLTGQKYHILPVVRHEQGGEVTYHLGFKRRCDFWDLHFYFVPKSGDIKTKQEAEKVITTELEVYTSWCNGEIYAVSIYDEVGELVDYNSGYYDIDDLIADLPSEWQSEDLEQYWVQ